ncbi:hypothetical protein Bealeia1_01099 [Candidatus Bealeia paramacronuclearis]|uniref:Helix-turn-helix domain-containing protein n=1 Tax=Candidatus Bealeia paramacronuclearis TaxID=1921001 RepID=A0ABZ2C3C9_9PROT|nr:hypothetical protein [Candidatus Bealeia paramacronuclearis]
MLKAWSKEELACLKAAMNESIQLKIIANYLGRTVSAISKVLVRQGIRTPSQKCGKPKGRKLDFSQSKKYERDIQVMKKLAVKYFGETFEQRRFSAIQKMHIPSSKILEAQDRFYRGRRRKKKDDFFHLPASLSVAKAWAHEEGLSFRPHWLSCTHSDPAYVVGQKLISETKLIMMINQARMDKGLKPFEIAEICWD